MTEAGAGPGPQPRPPRPARTAVGIKVGAVSDMAAWATVPAALALATRRRWRAPALAAATAGALAGAALRGTPQPPNVAVDGGVPLRVLTLNLQRHNLDATATLERLVTLEPRPDVVVLQEHTPATAEALGPSGVRKRWEHVVEDERDGYFGSAILADHPLGDAEVRTIGRRTMLAATLELGALRVRVVDVHAQAPVYARDVAPWNETWTDLGVLIDEARARGEAVVLAGDWNATVANRAFRHLLARHGLRDAAATRSRWLVAPTWPAGRWSLPPLITPDHIVVDAGMGVGDVQVHRLPATDHLALSADLLLPRS